MSAIPDDLINQLLAEDANKPKRGGGKKVDITVNRDLQTWMKLPHHLCLSDCEHRKQSPTGKACWNPNCVDPRLAEDGGTRVVFMVKDHMMCRYCYLDGWLT